MYACACTENILLVEDAPLVQNSHELLEREVIASLKQKKRRRLPGLQIGDGPLHLMVSDVVMPGKSGRELAGEAVHFRPVRKCCSSGWRTRSRAVSSQKLHSVPSKPLPLSTGSWVRETLDN
jgi:hypothetical protein